MADTVRIATPRVDDAKRRENEERAIQIKRVRALIQDMAIELAWIGFGSRTTTPEVVELQDRMLSVYSDFVEAAKSRSRARDYVTPAEHGARVEHSSPALRVELPHVEDQS